MKPKINAIKTNFIECAECGYERSCPYPEAIKHGRFSWYCPRCSRLWTGVVEKSGEVIVEKQSDNHEASAFVLIELPGGFAPAALMGTRRETIEAATKNGSPAVIGELPVDAAAEGKTRLVSDTLLLLQSPEPDADNNPRGLPRYRTSIL